MLRQPQQFSWLLDIDRSVPVVGYVRVSTRQQASRKTLERRTKHFELQLKVFGYNQLASFSCVEHGWTIQRQQSTKDQRGRLIAAIQFAEKHGGVVVAQTWDRFIRDENVKDHVKSKADDSVKSRVDKMPPPAAFDELFDWAGDVGLATICEPDLMPSEIEKVYQSYFSKPKGHGHRYSDDKKALNRQKAVGHRKRGLSYRDSGLLLGVSHMEVKRLLETENS